MGKRKRLDDRSSCNRISSGCKAIITLAACLKFLRMGSIRRNPIETVLLQRVSPVGRLERLEKLGLLRRSFL
jgi:hypothetical protein